MKLKSMMTKDEHHMLCLGVLADIYFNGQCTPSLAEQDKVIEEAIESAEKIGMPVSVARLKSGLPISTTLDN